MAGEQIKGFCVTEQESEASFTCRSWHQAVHAQLMHMITLTPCVKSYCLKNTNHSTGLPSSSALRVFTAHNQRKKWDSKTTKNESNTNLRVQANLITQLSVWSLIMSGWFLWADQLPKVLSWSNEWRPAHGSSSNTEFDFPWLSIAVARQRKYHLPPPCPTCLWSCTK